MLQVAALTEFHDKIEVLIVLDHIEYTASVNLVRVSLLMHVGAWLHIFQLTSKELEAPRCKCGDGPGQTLSQLPSGT